MEIKKIYKILKKVKRELETNKNGMIPIQLDSIYYASKILYKVIFTYNVSFSLMSKYENFLKNYPGVISRNNLSIKVSELIILYTEIIAIFEDHI